MSIVFSGSELINVAIGIERRGITFYDIMSRSTADENTRHVFRHLAGMEREHIKLFQEMLADADKYQPPENAAREYADYLQSLLDSTVFSDDTITSEMATQADTDIKALELGIIAEKDSILFYYQMRDIMPRQALPLMNRIIAEEKSHLWQLTEIKKNLTAA